VQTHAADTTLRFWIESQWLKQVVHDDEEGEASKIGAKRSRKVFRSMQRISMDCVEHQGFVLPTLEQRAFDHDWAAKMELYGKPVVVAIIVKAYNIRTERRKSFAHLHLCLIPFED